MASQKLLLCLVAVTVAVIISQVDSAAPQWPWESNNNTNKSHNLIVGSRMPGDRLVLRENVVKDSSWMRVVVVEKTYNTSRWDRITQVQALDQKTNGNGAYASILNGGPGLTNVTIRLKSQRGHGINFVIELYARA